MENVINKLKYFSKYFPEEALNEAIEMKEKITPILLEDLDKIIACPEIVLENEEYMFHIYSIFLLAKFKEKKAYSRIVKMVSFLPEEVDIIFGDVVTENLPSILYSTFNGDLESLKKIIENPLLDNYVRGAVLDVYGKLYSDGIVNKEDTIEYLKKLIYDRYNDEDFDLATDVQGFVVDWHIFEMIGDIQFLYDKNRIDTMIFGEYDAFIDSIYSYEYDRDDVRYIDDLTKEMSWWACFEKTEEQKLNTKIQMKEMEKSIQKQDRLARQLREKPKKIGRNEPCPCGSGKKYKKCCLEKDAQAGGQTKIEFVESAEEQEKWLRDYPSIEGERIEGQIRITDTFDSESIEIDKLVYLALHHRAIPIWIKRDMFREEMIMISYLSNAFEKFLSKCEKEGISSFDGYDKKYKIHYESEDWIETLKSIIQKNDFEYEYEELLEKIENITLSF